MPAAHPCALHHLGLAFDLAQVTEKKLKREFEDYGPVKRVRIVTDKNGKPGYGMLHSWLPLINASKQCTPPTPSTAGKSRGYGFVEFEDKKDMKVHHEALTLLWWWYGTATARLYSVIECTLLVSPSL
jgi:hypothetical protein